MLNVLIEDVKKVDEENTQYGIKDMFNPILLKIR